MFLLFYTRETNSSMHVGQFEVLLAELGPNQRRQRNDFRPGAMSGCVSEVKKKKEKKSIILLFVYSVLVHV